ncbi:FadR/GntR family transcriptional regulator [soil metagenome]
MRNELFERVCEDVKRLLREEPYRSGARLPAERKLAESFGVNRSTVREAVRSLVNLGLLQTRQGSGTSLRSDPGGLLQGPIEALLLLGESPVEDLYEARELVEVYLAGLAAARRTDEDLEAIHRSLARMRPDIGGTAEGYAEHNARFHEAVAMAAHNAILHRFMVSLIGGIGFTVRATQPAVESPEASFAAHVAIMEAIRASDSDAARRAMRRHMEIARAEWERSR